MVFARYVMFGEVYWHHAVRAATCMFARGFYEVRNRLDLGTLLLGTEADVIATLRQVARGTPAELLLEGIFGPRRMIYKRVLEATPHQHRELYERLSRRPFEFLMRCSASLAAELSPLVGRRLEPSEILIDAPPRHREVEFKVDIYFPKEEAYRPLQEVSPVVRALAGTQFDDYVKRVRLFAPPEVTRAIAGHPELNPRLISGIDNLNA